MRTYGEVEIEMEALDGTVTTVRSENVVRVICRSQDDAVQFHVEPLNTVDATGVSRGK